MSKQVKCEWCGNVFPYIKDNCTCPNCGGINSNLDKIIEENDEVHLSNKSLKKIIAIGGGLVACAIIAFGFMSKGIVHEVTNNVQVKNTGDLIVDGATAEQIYHTYKVKYDNFIETDNGQAKAIFPYFYLTEYVWNDGLNFTPGDVGINIYCYIEDRDTKNHDLELFVVKDGQRLPIEFTKWCFPMENVSKIEELFAFEDGRNPILYGNLYTKATDFDKITNFIVVVDGKEYVYDLEYSRNSKMDYAYVDKTIDISKTLNIKGDNAITIENLRIENITTIDYTDITLDVKTSIKNKLDDDVRIFIEDSKGKLYEVYNVGFGGFYHTSEPTDEFKYLVREDGECYLMGKTFLRDQNPKSVHIFVGKDEYIAEITK